MKKNSGFRLISMLFNQHLCLAKNKMQDLQNVPGQCPKVVLQKCIGYSSHVSLT